MLGSGNRMKDRVKVPLSTVSRDQSRTTPFMYWVTLVELMDFIQPGLQKYNKNSYLSRISGMEYFHS